MINNINQVASEWDCKFSISSLGSKPLTISISASEDERKNISRRLNVDAIDKLTAKLIIERQGQGNVIYISGVFCAVVKQKCVVSLDEVYDEVENAIEGWFTDHEEAISLAKVRHERLSNRLDAEVPLLEEKDDPEPVMDGKIVLGELVIQHLSLSINPYPQSEKVLIEENSSSTNTNVQAVDSVYVRENPTYRPFSRLKNWKDKKEDNSDN